MRRFTHTNINWKAKEIEFGTRKVPMKEYLYLEPSTRGEVVCLQDCTIGKNTTRIIANKSQTNNRI